MVDADEKSTDLFCIDRVGTVRAWRSLWAVSKVKLILVLFLDSLAPPLLLVATIRFDQ